MNPDNYDHPLTAGEWHKQTRIERSIAGYFLLFISVVGNVGAASAMYAFYPGELTGHRYVDLVVLVAIVGTSGFSFRQGLYLLQGPVCRACRTRLSEDQFRCSHCTALVSETIRTRT